MKADILSLATWAEQGDEGGQENHRTEKGDQHADAGDQPQLGDATEVGWHKGQEPGRRRRGGHQYLTPDPAPGLGQRRGQFGDRGSHLAQAHAELDGEIDRDADEQDREGDRYQVQRTDSRRGEDQGQDQPGPQCQQYGNDQPPAMNR